jgi:hypothetical protein
MSIFLLAAMLRRCSKKRQTLILAVFICLWYITPEVLKILRLNTYAALPHQKVILKFVLQFYGLYYINIIKISQGQNYNTPC